MMNEHMGMFEVVNLNAFLKIIIIMIIIFMIILEM